MVLVGAANPFYHQEFQRWLTNSVKLTPADIILEPFAGSNNLVKMLQDTGITNSFQSYDIDPQADNIVQRDTIAHFPAGHRVAITNPPYISKSSSTKKGFQIGMEEYTELQLEHYTPEPVKMRFKVPTGRIGLFALDDTKSATIRFCQGEEIPGSKVKPSGNCITRIDIEVDDVDNIVSRANKILNRHRQSSGDAGFIIYRQMRDDGTTRRRLGFELARQILNMAIAGW